jgi:hypothetical protein
MKSESILVFKSYNEIFIENKTVEDIIIQYLKLPFLNISDVSILDENEASVPKSDNHVHSNYLWKILYYS